ncbi:MAG: AMP-binding protein [Crocinitomicaceae bacterium]|nr:AMP-binding protein [Crocinitomicaceae bacterium]
MKINHSNIPELRHSYEEFINEWNNDLGYIEIQTSGSTGKPKTIRLAKTSMLASAKKTLQYFNLKKHDRVILCLPIQTIAAKMMIVRAIQGNLELELITPSTTPLKEINKEASFIAMTPMQASSCLNKCPNKYRHLDKVLLGGAPIDLKLEKDLLNLKPMGIYHSYGMTETASHIAIRKLSNEKDKKYTALPGINFEIDSRDCLIINYPEVSTSKIISNDVIQLLNSSTFIWKGRHDFIINSGGIKIHVEELEKRIRENFDLPFFISSIEDRELGEKIVMYIESTEYIDTQLIKNKLVSILEKHQIPKEYFVLPQFKYNQGGKIDRIKTKSHAPSQ